jgi:hypothetical protein
LTMFLDLKALFTLELIILLIDLIKRFVSIRMLKLKVYFGKDIKSIICRNNKAMLWVILVG